MKIRLNKINCFSIIENHLRTLVTYSTGKPSVDDWFTFFILPIILSGVMFYINGTTSSNTVNLIITALSIFVGLLINVLVLIFSLIQQETTKEIKIRILKETISNISYTIIISIITIIICLLTFINNHFLLVIATLLIYFFVVNFFITLMMIVKRMYLLFTDQLDQFQKEITKKKLEDLK